MRRRRSSSERTKCTLRKKERTRCPNSRGEWGVRDRAGKKKAQKSSGPTADHLMALGPPSEQAGEAGKQRGVSFLTQKG